MTNTSLHILFEHGLHDLTAFGSSQIRLIRPLSHPDLQSVFQVTFGPEYFGELVDAVVVDRLWKPRISLAMARSLLNDICRNKAKFIYALDDNFLNLNHNDLDFKMTSEMLNVVKYFLNNAEGVIVTTDGLKEQLLDYNSQILVVPNMIDERLISSSFIKRVREEKIVVGYMGTHTHDADLKLVIPAMQEIMRAYPGRVQFQVLGITTKQETLRILETLPAEIISPASSMRSYDRFTPWFQENIHWDIGLCPLLDTPFNQCKSDIKYLDYGAAGIAGIYSRVPSYASVRHLETGYLVDNNIESWVRGIKQLIENTSLRYQIANNAHDYVISQRTVKASATNIIQAINSILERKLN